jgi:GT2 family glycosyltransferase
MGPVLGPPVVSIVIPSRNRPDAARTSASCGLAQVGVPVEVVLVDDGSDVPLEHALRDLVERSQGRLRIVRNESAGGVAAARNHGIEHALGEWIGFCDDDDLWAPWKVRDQLAAARASGATWTCSGAMAVGPERVPLKALHAPMSGDISVGMLRNNLIPGGASSVIARADLVRSVGGFDPWFSTLADWDMWIRLSRAGQIATVHRPLVAYVVHSGGMSNDIKLLQSDMSKLESKYREQRIIADVEISQRAWMAYIGRMHLRADRRLDAARALTVVARHTDRPGRWKAPFVALISPRWLLDRRQQLERSNIPRSWSDEFAAWFGPLARGEEPLDVPVYEPGWSGR